MMAKYDVFFTRQALKDLKTLSPKLQKKLKEILKEVIAAHPHRGKKLLGEFGGNYSYRLSLKDRIVYSIDEPKKQVYLKRVRTHYGD